MKKDFSKNWTKDVSDSFKLDPNDSKLVEQTVGSMLDKVNKYVMSPEGMKMRQGFIRLPFGPDGVDAEVKPELPEIDSKIELEKTGKVSPISPESVSKPPKTVRVWIKSKRGDGGSPGIANRDEYSQ